MSEDEDRRRLERLAKAGDKDALTRLQVMNARIGSSQADAAYLAKYVDLCERLLSNQYYNKGFRGTPNETTKVTRLHALKQLIDLNEKFKLVVGPDTLKFTIPGVHLAYDGATRGWQEGEYTPVEFDTDIPNEYAGWDLGWGIHEEDAWVPSEVNC